MSAPWEEYSRAEREEVLAPLRTEAAGWRASATRARVAQEHHAKRADGREPCAGAYGMFWHRDEARRHEKKAKAADRRAEGLEALLAYVSKK